MFIYFATHMLPIISYFAVSTEHLVVSTEALAGDKAYELIIIFIMF